MNSRKNSQNSEKKKGEGSGNPSGRSPGEGRAAHAKRIAEGRKLKAQRRAVDKRFRKQTPEEIAARVNHRGEGRVQRFHVRANFLGMLNFVCPYCGMICHRRLIQRRYVVKCTGCRAMFVPKIGLCPVPLGRRNIPPDYVIPDALGDTYLMEAFPEGDMGAWKQGQCVHEVLPPIDVEVEP